MNTVSSELLRKLAGQVTPPPPREPVPTAPPQGKRTDNERALDEAWANAGIDAEIADLKATRADSYNRNNQLNESAFAIGQIIHYVPWRAWEAKQELASVARGIGLRDSEIDRTIQSGWGDGEREPRYRPQHERVYMPQREHIRPDSD